MAGERIVFVENPDGTWSPQNVSKEYADEEGYTPHSQKDYQGSDDGRREIKKQNHLQKGKGYSR